MLPLSSFLISLLNSVELPLSQALSQAVSNPLSRYLKFIPQGLSKLSLKHSLMCYALSQELYLQSTYRMHKVLDTNRSLLGLLSEPKYSFENSPEAIKHTVYLRFKSTQDQEYEGRNPCLKVNGKICKEDTSVLQLIEKLQTPIC